MSTVPTNPADCDRATVYTGECRNFSDTEWIRFDSGRRRSPDARDGNTWLIDVAHGSFWMSDDKVRNLVPLVPAPTAGQWIRADLPSLPDVLGEVTTHERGEGAAAYRTAALAHLDAHHPKPDSSGVDWKSMYEHEIRNRVEAVDRAARAERERDESLRKKGEMVDRAVRAERERDAAVARAEQAEAALERVTFEPDPIVYAVRESDVAAIEVRKNGGHWSTPRTCTPSIGETVEDIRRTISDGLQEVAECEAVARAVEAGQDVDPVEEKARELYEVGNPGTVGMWESIHEAFKDGYRRIALHVLGQEASSDE